jgi:hypothetical protein
MNVKAGDRIWASFKNAHINVRRTPSYLFFFLIVLNQPADFPNPTVVDPSRPLESYNLNGAGFHTCPGVTYAEQTIAEIVKVVFQLKNVRRAAGDPGKLAGFKTIINETETNVYLTPYGTTSPWPGSMYLVVRLQLFRFMVGALIVASMTTEFMQHFVVPTYLSSKYDLCYDRSLVYEEAFVCLFTCASRS